MELSLKKVKYFDEMSEETPCFVAELYDKGVHMATVKNDGHGGGNMLYPVKGKTYKDIAKYDNLDVECDIFKMVYVYDTVTKYQNKGLVIKKNDVIKLVGFNQSVAKLKKTPQGVRALYNAKEKYITDGYQVLNRNL
jgi:uncharacterized transporter YbjL